MPERYAYPGAEAITDRLERYMDAYKLQRERLALELCLQSDWRSALDVGCGVGRYFESYARAAALRPGLARELHAIEPDDARRAQAEREARRLAGACPDLRIRIARDLSGLSDAQRFDLIACAQVVGHLTPDDCDQLLATLQRLRTPTGAVVLLLPVVMNEAIAELVPWTAQANDDYFYAVDLHRMPDDPDYAAALDADGYTRLVRQPEPGRLPVRAFNAGPLPIDGAAMYPCPLSCLPAPVARSLNAQSVFSLVYSVHRYSKRSGRAILGDALIRLC